MIRRLLIGGTGMQSHPHFPMVGANEIGEQVKLVGCEIENFLFNGCRPSTVDEARMSAEPIGFSGGVEQLAPWTK